MPLNDVMAVIRKEAREIYDGQTMRTLFLIAGGLAILPVLPLLVLIVLLALSAVSPTAGTGAISALNETAGALSTPVMETYNDDPSSSSLLWLAIYVEILLLFPSKVISDTISGELEKNSAEPILATPVSTRDLILGKIIAANLAPLAPLYAGVLISTILFSVLKYGEATPMPSLAVYAAVLFVLIPLCTLADTIIVATVRLVFKKGFMQRVLTGMVTPGGVVSFAVLGACLIGKIAALAAMLPEACIVLAIASIACFPVLVRAYDRDNIIMKAKDA